MGGLSYFFADPEPVRISGGSAVEFEPGIISGDPPLSGENPELQEGVPPEMQEQGPPSEITPEPPVQEPDLPESPDDQEPEIQEMPAPEIPEEGDIMESEPVQESEPETSEGTISTTEALEPAESEGGAMNGLLLWGAIALIAALLLAAVVIIFGKKKRVVTERTSPAAAPRTTTPEVDSVPVPQRIRAAVHQHIGARDDQQDSYVVSDPSAYVSQGMLAVVADGMGGLANGSAVSGALTRSFLEGFRRGSAYNQPSDMLLEQAIRANAQINQMLRGADRSGSTLVAAMIRNGYLHFLTVGDSRIYLCRGGSLIQLNREHIYQEELAVKALNQQVPINQVRGDRQAHALTSYFGIGRIPSIDRNYEGIKLVEGDRIMLASDGVFGTLTTSQMEEALKGSVTEAAKKIGAMIRETDKPYQDNNTAVILEYVG